MNHAGLTTLLGFPALCLALTSATAQEPGSEGFSFDPVESSSSDVPGATCYKSDRYIVVERHETDQVDSDFFVRPRQTEDCEADSLPGDFVLRHEWAGYFAGLHGDVMFIDSGTGPDLRWLILMNLSDRRRLTELSYVELVSGPDSVTVGVWDGSELKEPLPGCEAPPGGLIPGVDSLFFLDVRTGRKRFGGQTRCAHRQ